MATYMTEDNPLGLDSPRPGGWGYRPAEVQAAEPLDYAMNLPVPVPDGQTAQLHLVFTRDGLYAPAVIRTPAGPGPFPAVICMHGGSGGLGISWLVDRALNRGSILDRFVDEGYAVCWTEGRREIPDAYGTDIRAVLDHEDIITTYRYLERLPSVAADRIALFGVSHGGELQLKVISELGDGPAALVPCEPAAHEFLSLRHDGPHGEEHMRYHEPLRDDQIDLEAAMERIERISPDVPILILGRDDDHNQGLFMKAHELLQRAGKNVEWGTIPHAEHAFHWGPWRERRHVLRKDGHADVESSYELDELQRSTTERIVAFLNRHVRDA